MLKLAGFWRGSELEQCLEVLGNERLRRDEQEGMVEHPVVVGVGRDVGSLERVGPEVEQLGHSQLHHGLTPDPHGAGRPLLQEDELEVVVAKSGDIGVVGDVEDSRSEDSRRPRRSGTAIG